MNASAEICYNFFLFRLNSYSKIDYIFIEQYYRSNGLIRIGRVRAYIVISKQTHRLHHRNVILARYACGCVVLFQEVGWEARAKIAWLSIHFLIVRSSYILDTRWSGSLTVAVQLKFSSVRINFETRRQRLLPSGCCSWWCPGFCRMLAPGCPYYLIWIKMNSFEHLSRLL